MHRHFLVYLGSVLLLSSCMLDQTPPKPPVTLPPMLMQVKMVDLGGSERRPDHGADSGKPSTAKLRRAFSESARHERLSRTENA